MQGYKIFYNVEMSKKKKLQETLQKPEVVKD